MPLDPERHQKRFRLLEALVEFLRGTAIGALPLEHVAGLAKLPLGDAREAAQSLADSGHLEYTGFVIAPTSLGRRSLEQAYDHLEAAKRELDERRAQLECERDDAVRRLYHTSPETQEKSRLFYEDAIAALQQQWRDVESKIMDFNSSYHSQRSQLFTPSVVHHHIAGDLVMTDKQVNQNFAGGNYGVAAGGDVKDVTNQVQIGSGQTMNGPLAGKELSSQEIAKILASMKTALPALEALVGPEKAKDAKVELAQAQGLVADDDPELKAALLPRLAQLAEIFHVLTDNHVIGYGVGAIASWLGLTLPAL